MELKIVRDGIKKHWKYYKDMAKIRESRNSNGKKQYEFICPACNCEHTFDDRWLFNHDYNKPTISPSFLQEGFLGFKDEAPMYGRCHSFINNGMIQYLGDCSHELAGKTVKLPEIDDN